MRFVLHACVLLMVVASGVVAGNGPIDMQLEEKIILDRIRLKGLEDNIRRMKKLEATSTSNRKQDTGIPLDVAKSILINKSIKPMLQKEKALSNVRKVPSTAAKKKLTKEANAMPSDSSAADVPYMETGEVGPDGLDNPGYSNE
jgi:hypothetical protein|eukprot:Stramenopile-MAST_4_protein_5084